MDFFPRHPHYIIKDKTPTPEVPSHLGTRKLALRKVTMFWMALPLGLLFGCWIALICLHLMFLRF
jgi:hypothetical protein